LECDAIEADVRFAAARSLEKSLTKKMIEVDDTVEIGASQERSKRAITRFLASNERCCRAYSDVEQKRLINEMAHKAHRQLPELWWDQIIACARHGPGASIGSKGRNSNFEKFFCNQMTATDFSLYVEYAKYIEGFPTWALAEKQRRALWADHPVCEIVAGSKLSTVPKNSETDRVICTEPVLNGFFQQGIGSILESVLRREYGYDKAKQPNRNRYLAHLGSLRGNIATIDLSDASDSISMGLVKALLPSDWVAAIEDTRSPVTQLPNKEVITLNMVSSMGNGFTFNLMTYIFTLVLHVVADRRGENIHRSLCGVFGDDICCPTDWYQDVLDALVLLGFTPNKEKSFGDGLFRESCGTDWYRGENIRGVYIKRLASLQDVYSAINRLNRWSVIFRVRLPETKSFLWELGARYHREMKVKRKGAFPNYVPFDTAVTSGVQVPSLSAGYPVTYYAWVPTRKQFAIFARNELDRTTWAYDKIKPAYNNWPGVVLSWASGWIRKGCLLRRPDEVVYKRQKCLTLGWNYIPPLPWQRRVTASDWTEILMIR